MTGPRVTTLATSGQNRTLTPTLQDMSLPALCGLMQRGVL